MFESPFGMLFLEYDHIDRKFRLFMPADGAFIAL
jgi:hypothetical protein